MRFRLVKLVNVQIKISKKSKIKEIKISSKCRWSFHLQTVPITELVFVSIEIKFLTGFKGGEQRLANVHQLMRRV